MSDSASSGDEVDLGTHRLRVWSEGDGDVAFVCLHGLLERSGTWDLLAPKLTALGRVIRIDQRGHGLSNAPEGPCTRDDLAADVVAVMDSLGVKSAVIVGHNLGGVVGLSAAIATPDRVKGVVAIGAMSECNEQTAGFYAQVARGGEVNWLEGLARSYWGPMSTQVVEGYPESLVEVARVLQALHENPLTPHLGQIQCPVVAIAGDRGQPGTAPSKTIADAAANGKLIALTGKGDHCHTEAPDEVAQAVQAILS